MDAILLIKGPRLKNHPGVQYKVQDAITGTLFDDHMYPYPITIEEISGSHSGDYMEIQLGDTCSSNWDTTQVDIDRIFKLVIANGVGAVVLIEEDNLCHSPTIVVAKDSCPGEVKAAYLKWRAGVLNRLDGSIELAIPSVSIEKS